MRITRLKHAAFLLEAADHRLAVDLGDYTTPDTTRGLGRLDGVVASHGHSDHYMEANILAAAARVAAPSDVVARLPSGLDARTLRLGETLSFAGFAITPTLADHGPKLSTPIENYGLVIEHDGRRLYYVGDAVTPLPSPEGPFDLVLVSVDGSGFVFNAQQAAQFIRAMGHNGPVIPIHDGDGEEPWHAKDFIHLAAEHCQPRLVAPGQTVQVGS